MDIKKRLAIPCRTDLIILASVLALNVPLVYDRMKPGIPLSVDTSSHLYKAIFIFDSFTQHGYIPSWCSDWYGGTPFLLLYPPLSYFLVLLVALAGVGPLLAYKIVGIFFYLLGPVTVYALARELRFEELVAAISAAIFSLTPIVVDDYLFYDRFPNIVALPLACLFLASLNKILSGKWPVRLAVVPISLLSAVILTHHLSALYIGIIVILLLIARSIASRRWLMDAAKASGIILASFLVCSFWLVPFMQSFAQLAENPFYNRNIEFPFVRFSYFLLEVVTYQFGLLHFVLALLAFVFIIRRKASRRGVYIFGIYLLTVSFGMISFEVGEMSQLKIAMIAGQLLIISSFCLLSALVITSFWRTTSDQAQRALFIVLWFVAFLWLSFGWYALPVVTVEPLRTIWRSLDVHRFWLYLAIPTSILASLSLRKSASGSFSHKKFRRIFLASFIVSFMIVGAFVKAFYSVNRTVDMSFLPYNTRNADIPEDVIEYFRGEQAEGRILAIKCPLWIYVLPHYVGKPLIDGWYPQEKILDRVLKINDYRINDLESSKTDENRTLVWRGLLEDSRSLCINWVMIGSSSIDFQRVIVQGTKFYKSLEIHYDMGNLTIYRSAFAYQMAELLPDNCGRIEARHAAPDRIVLELVDLNQSAEIIVKEAYFPGWFATMEGAPLNVDRSNTPPYVGYITLSVPAGEHRIELVYKSESGTWMHVSAVTFTVLIAIALLGEWRVRSHISRKAETQ